MVETVIDFGADEVRGVVRQGFGRAEEPKWIMVASEEMLATMGESGFRV